MNSRLLGALILTASMACGNNPALTAPTDSDASGAWVLRDGSDYFGGMTVVVIENNVSGLIYGAWSVRADCPPPTQRDCVLEGVVVDGMRLGPRLILNLMSSNTDPTVVATFDGSVGSDASLSGKLRTVFVVNGDSTRAVVESVVFRRP